MSRLQIFCDVRFDDSAVKLLREGIAPHQLVLPQQPSKNMWAGSVNDPALARADIAFGQPDAPSVLQARQLRWLQVTSAGYTRYDTAEFRAAAAAQNLLVTNSSTVFAEPCAEHVFAFLLAQVRQLPAGLRTRYGSPSSAQLHHACVSLKNQEIVILGYGAIGARLIEMLAPFQLKITAMRRQPRGQESVLTVTPDHVAGALATADHVIDILPDNASSYRFMNQERFAQMKPGAAFYNIGRGTTVDQIALAENLRSGHLAAAWLDVTDPEPLPENDPLWTTPNCHITPHTAGSHDHASASLVRHFLQNFQLFLQSSPLHDRVI